MAASNKEGRGKKTQIFLYERNDHVLRIRGSGQGDATILHRVWGGEIILKEGGRKLC